MCRRYCLFLSPLDYFSFSLFIFRYVNPAFCKAFLWLSRGSHQWNDVCCVPLNISWTEILVFQQAGKDKLLQQKPDCVLEIKSDPCHVETTCRILCSSTEASVFETTFFCLLYFQFFFPPANSCCGLLFYIFPCHPLSLKYLSKIWKNNWSILGLQKLINRNMCWAFWGWFFVFVLGFWGRWVCVFWLVGLVLFSWELRY